MPVNCGAGRAVGVDLVARSDLGLLAEVEVGPCVSIYLPTHRAGAETRQDPIGLKNLLRQVEETLAGQGLDGAGIETLLSPVRALVDDYGFWQHQKDGLAIFRSPDLFFRYRVDLRLPELAVVAERFHLKPLLPCLTGDGRFYVLALSQNRARLLRATRDGIVELDPEGMPASLAEALRDRVAQKQLQTHSASPFHRGRGAAIFHGHGGGEESRKELLFAYFRRIDRGLQDLLAEERAPLIVAAVDYLYPIYRRANTSRELLAGWISGNPDDLTPQELHERALPLVSGHLLRARRKAADQYLEAWHTQRASNRPEDVLAAAHNGRVQSLFVAVGVQLWGTFNARTREVALRDGPSPGAQDLLNLAAIQTFANGGIVYAVAPAEVPGGGPVAAVFRY
jgi:Bacterial archaeo-eukaryotic release factor family 3